MSVRLKKCTSSSRCLDKCHHSLCRKSLTICAVSPLHRAVFPSVRLSAAEWCGRLTAGARGADAAGDPATDTGARAGAAPAAAAAAAAVRTAVLQRRGRGLAPRPTRRRRLVSRGGGLGDGVSTSVVMDAGRACACACVLMSFLLSLSSPFLCTVSQTMLKSMATRYIWPY